jgi:hypothetical protein
MQSHFIHEDDLDTFEGFLRYQGFDPSTASADVLVEFREIFDENQIRKSERRGLGTMNFGALKPREHRYAVAVREGADLLLTLWIKRAPGDVYVMIPRDRGQWNPHASYHKDGSFHHKSHDNKMMGSKRQPLNAAFKGCETFGMTGGPPVPGGGGIPQRIMASSVPRQLLQHCSSAHAGTFTQDRHIKRGMPPQDDGSRLVATPVMQRRLVGQ